MGRLIDADATFELLRSLGSRDYRREKGTIMDAMKMISHPEYTPTVDAVEVVHGRWKNNHCTVCGMTPLGEELWDHLDIEPPRFELCMDYCPICGAKMDGDGNG